MNSKVGAFYKTDDYSRFKVLDGNRDVTMKRAQKLVKSIKDVGFLYSPILVNEKNEVIDGQARLEACKLLGIPVMYITQEGIGLRECLSMNVGQENWKIIDYIKSYASLGNIDYIHLLNLLKEFPKLPLQAIVVATKGTLDSNSNTIISGAFTCTDKEYEEARHILIYEMQFYDLFATKKFGGRKDLWYYAIAFAYRTPSINKQVLAEHIISKQYMIAPVATAEQAIEVIEQMYNHMNRKKVYLKTEYLKYMDEVRSRLGKERKSLKGKKR